MKGRRILLVIGGAIGLMLALGFFWRRGVTYHTYGWNRATRLAMGGQAPWRDRIYGAMISQKPQYWWDQTKRHEAELLKMGYLTNCEFRLTNQVITREFSSNFFWLISRRAGTNEDQVWRCMELTNRTGLSPMFPVKDYAIWEQTFRECAARYASNLPSTTTTNSGQ